MKRLILEELKKIKASKLLVGICIFNIAVMIVGGFFLRAESELERACQSPIRTMSLTAFTFFFFYGLTVIKMIAKEYEDYVVGDAIRAGVDRRQYFGAKCIALSIFVAVLQFFMSLALFATFMIKIGIRLGFSFSIEFVFKFLLNYLVMVLLILIMSSIAMLISYICKNFKLATAVIFVLFVIVDLKLPVSYVTPTGMVLRMLNNNEYMFNSEFWVELIPSIIVGVAAVVASYIIFMKTEFASVEEREAEKQ